MKLNTFYTSQEFGCRTKLSDQDLKSRNYSPSFNMCLCFRNPDIPHLGEIYCPQEASGIQCPHQCRACSLAVDRLRKVNLFEAKFTTARLPDQITSAHSFRILTIVISSILNQPARYPILNIQFLGIQI